jgi:membrane fusion protein
VQLRYSAYPYQKFGQYAGTVMDVGRSPLLPAELPYPLAPRAEATSNMTGASSTEPLFRIRVALQEQSAIAYGVRQPLQSGMQLEAAILLDTRTIFEWLLEPLYALSGRFVE